MGSAVRLQNVTWDKFLNNSFSSLIPKVAVTMPRLSGILLRTPEAQPRFPNLAPWAPQTVAGSGRARGTSASGSVAAETALGGLCFFLPHLEDSSPVASGEIEGGGWYGREGETLGICPQGLWNGPVEPNV